jgi:hypothetical protein
MFARTACPERIQRGEPRSAKLQRRIVPRAHLGDRVAVSRLSFSHLPVIQPLSFQTLTDSFTPRAPNNHFVINTLRTLSFAMGAYTPLIHFSSFFAIDPALLSLLESHRLQTPTHQPLSNHIVTKTMGWGHCFARVRRLPRLPRPSRGSGRGASRRGRVSRRNRPARQPSRKFHARAELHLRGARRTPPAPSSQ